jgi:hypothetical protein
VLLQHQAQSSSIDFCLVVQRRLDHLELSVSHISDTHPFVLETKIAVFNEDYQQPAIPKRYSIVTVDLQVVNCEKVKFGYQQVIHIPLSMQTQESV